MTRSTYLLDTNAIAAILKRDSRIINRATEALAIDARLILSPVVFYQV
jgi:predicted nucleic acid-binding protein